MNYQEIDNKSALHKVNGRFPYHWDLNIYRGCGHGCKYCFALYTHQYLNDDAYFDTIYYKKNIIELLEKELSSPKWKGEVINIGGITDSYQPLEKKLKIMPEILKLMIRYKNPIIISTKSSLILRDLPLIKELAELTYVNVACTITAMDEKIRKALEPNGSPSLERFWALKRIKEETKATVGVHLMPIVPYFTDNIQNLETIYSLASRIHADYVLASNLNLRGKTRTYFFDFVRKYDLRRYEKIQILFEKGVLNKEYKIGLYQVIHSLEKKHSLSNDYMKKFPKKKAPKQNSLF